MAEIFMSQSFVIGLVLLVAGFVVYTWLRYG